jgi:Tol biopolymer transport system component
LWIANVETGEKRFLCEHDAMQPSWSPNGDRIAFWFMPPSAGRSDIATISRNGGEIEVVTKDASTNWNPFGRLTASFFTSPAIAAAT